MILYSLLVAAILLKLGHPLMGTLTFVIALLLSIPKGPPSKAA